MPEEVKEELLAEYLDVVIAETDRIDIKGIFSKSGEGRQALCFPIEALYTPLATQGGRPAGGASPASGSQPKRGRRPSGGNGRTLHNTCATEWHRLNRAVLDEACPSGDHVMFTRSGFTGEHGVAQVVWTGAFRRAEGL